MKKPILNFPKNHLIYLYLEADYRKCETYNDIVNYFHKWHNDMLTSKNPVRVECIKSIIFPLYSMLTGVSYESKNIVLN